MLLSDMKAKKKMPPNLQLEGIIKKQYIFIVLLLTFFFQIFLFYMNQNLMHKIYIEQSMSQVKIRNVEHHVYISYNALTQQSKHSMFVIDKARLQDPDV